MQTSPLNEQPATESFDPGRLLRVLKRWFFLIVLAAVLGGVLAGYYASKQPNIYQGQAKLQLDVTSPMATLGSESSEQAAMGTQEHMATQIAVITSQSIAWDVIRKLGLYKNRQVGGSPAYVSPDAISDTERLSLLRAFKAGLSASIERGTEIVDVTYTSTDPDLAATVPNAILDAFIERNYQSRFEGITKQAEWLDTQLDRLKKRVDQDQKDFVDFQRRTGLFMTEENHGAIFDRFNQINTALANAQVQRIDKEIAYRQSLMNGPTGDSLVTNGTIEAARQQLGQMQADSAQLEAKFDRKYPKIAQIHNQIEQQTKLIQTLVNAERGRIRAEYEAAANNEKSLSDSLEQQKQQIFGTNQETLEYSLRQRQVAAGRDLIESLTRQLQMARLSSGLNTESVTVLDRALRPNVPISPRKRLDVEFGIAGGLFFGLVISLLLESLDRTVKTISDVASVSEAPILTIIPSTSGLRNSRDAGGPVGTYSIRNPFTAYAESFRRLRSSLLLASAGGAPKVIAVVSAWPREGKTTTASGLAEVFAQTGKHVLLVDADLRRPSLHFIFGIPGNARGLSTLLTQPDEDQASLLVTPLAELPTLQVLPAGLIPPRPSELLLSDRMKELVQLWRESYDVVILDTAPILAVSDTSSLSQLVDSIVLMVRSGLTTRDSLRAASQSFQSAKANVAGLILNAFPDEKKSGYYTSGYYGTNLNAFKDEGWHEEN